jgi:hypothetical protein
MSDPKYYKQYDSIYLIISKEEYYGDGDKSGYQGLGMREGQITKRQHKIIW